jgi:hypothetical protein
MLRLRQQRSDRDNQTRRSSNRDSIMKRKALIFLRLLRALTLNEWVGDSGLEQHMANLKEA